MMRPARRATLLVAFCLLTSAATAYAECAWVLSQMSQIQNPSNPHLATRVYGAIGAWGTEGECWRKGKDMRDCCGSAPDTPRGLVTYYCLPDTVDPREPKAK
jgi:hypothetical protein